MKILHGKELKADVTADDIYNAGFESGVFLSFFMLRNTIKKSMKNYDIVKLAHWFELKGPGCSFDDLYSIMIRALCLDNDDETREAFFYEDTKR